MDDLTETDGPAVPILKKQDRERKGGAVWFSFFTGKAGVAALTLGVGGAGLVGYGMLRGSSVQTEETSASLEGPGSDIHLRKRDSQGSRSLNYASEAGRGQLNWGASNAPRPADALPVQPLPPERTPRQAVPEEPLPARDLAPAPRAQTRAANDLPGARLTSKSSFGKHDIFSGGTGFQMKRGFNASQPKFQRPRLESLSQDKAPPAERRMVVSNASAGRVMGQLRFARVQSQMGARTEAEGGSAYSAQAFEQHSVSAGRIPDPRKDDGVLGGGVVRPQGGGAPSLEDSSAAAPRPEALVNRTPYQGLVDEAQKVKDMSQNMMEAGLTLLALAAALAVGGATAASAAIVAGIGTSLLVISQSLSVMGQQMGKTVSSGYGQRTQGSIMEGGTGSPGSAMPPLQDGFHPAAQEESNAAFH